MKDETIGMYNYISSAATTIVKATPGILRRIVITEKVNNTIKVYDNASIAGTIIASFVVNAVEGTYEFNCAFRIGLVVITAGNSKLTVVYE